MTEPMNIQTFGGAKVNMNEVKSKEVIKDKKTGKKTFLINFKNGTKVQYPAQSANNRAAIRSGALIDGSNQTDISRFYGLEFTGNAQKHDGVMLEGSRNCKIDVSDPSYDFVGITDDRDTKKIFKSGNNTVIGKNDDIADHNTLIDIDKFGAHHEGDRPEQLR